MYYGFKTAHKVADYVIILGLNCIAFFYNITGITILFAMPIGISIIISILGSFDEVWKRGKTGLIWGSVIASILFVAGCGFHWYSLARIESDADGNKLVLLIEQEGEQFEEETNKELA